MGSTLYGLMADAVLALHLLIVAFNIVMVPLAWIAVWRRFGRGWGWVARPAVRWTHVGMMALIAMQSLLGQHCPLTILEQALRDRAGQSGYEGSFIGHLMGRIMYWEFPEWVFIVIYVGWFGVVGATWWCVKRAKWSRACVGRSGL